MRVSVELSGAVAISYIGHRRGPLPGNSTSEIDVSFKKEGKVH